MEQIQEYIKALAAVLNRDSLTELATFGESVGTELPHHPISRELCMCKLQCSTPGVLPELKAKAKAWIEKNGFSTEIF